MAENGTKKGFAGLETLLTDVELPRAEGAMPREQPRAAQVSSNRPTPPSSDSPAPPSGQRSAAPSSPFYYSGVVWLLGLFGAILLGAVIVGSNPSTSPQVASSPSSAPTSPSVARAPEAPPAQPRSFSPEQVIPPSPPPARAKPPTPPASPEEKPPIGTGHTLSTPQIRYCVYESIRIDGASSVVDRYSQSEVDRFNNLVSDYNNRCGSFRYRRGALEPIQAEAAANQQGLMNQGSRAYMRAVGR